MNYCHCYHFDWSIFWNALTSLITLGLVIIGYWQLIGFNRTTHADFAHKLNKDFFNPETRQLLMLLNYDVLDFELGEEIKIEKWEKPEKCPYFRINKAALEKINSSIQLVDEKKEIYTVFEVEDAVLNYFEDLYNLYEKKILSLGEIETDFGGSLEIVMDNKDIQAYLKYYRGTKEEVDYDPDYYIKCDKLYTLIKVL